MNCRRLLLAGGAVLIAGSRLVTAQQAVSAIEQSRLFQKTPSATGAAVTADGMVLGDSDNSPGDDSFGAQMILKDQARAKHFLFSGDVSAFYTNNAALTSSDTISDMFFTANAGASWVQAIGSHLEAQLAAHGSVFRYADTSALDFESLGVGAGISWTPASLPGVSGFVRYDFTELLSRRGRELLQDHEFNAGAQKVFALGRSHALSMGVLGSAGISDPHAAQRDGLGAFVAYHLQISRALEGDISYRYTYYFYNSGDRQDSNNVLSLGVRYHLASWAELTGTISLGANRSNQDAFNYDVFNAGGGVALQLRF